MAQEQRQLVELTFDESEEAINVFEIGAFLVIFGNVHDVAAEILEQMDQERPERDLLDTEKMRLFVANGALLDLLRKVLRPSEQGFVLRPNNLSAHNALQIEAIGKASPLRIAMLCIPIALTMAVILSGGEVEMPGFKCKVPAIGVGLHSIVSALSQPSTDQSHP